MAAGENLGKDSVTTVVDGDLDQAGSHRASFGFVPVRAVVYSTEYNREILAEFTWGMSREDVRSLCTYAGLQFFLGGEDDGINIEDSRYCCYFDETGGLSALTIQTGSSRDERFTVDKTTLEEVQQIVTDAGGTLTLLTPREIIPGRSGSMQTPPRGPSTGSRYSRGKSLSSLRNS